MRPPVEESPGAEPVGVVGQPAALVSNRGFDLIERLEMVVGDHLIGQRPQALGRLKFGRVEPVPAKALQYAHMLHCTSRKANWINGLGFLGPKPYVADIVGLFDLCAYRSAKAGIERSRSMPSRA